jgi:hypothetical protein
MRGLILAAFLGAGLHAQAPRGTAEPGKPDALAQFKNQLEELAAQTAQSRAQLDQLAAQAAQKDRVFLTPEQSRKYFTESRSFPSAPMAEPKQGLSLQPGQPCAIPLLNVLPRGNVDPKMILPAGPPVDARIRIVAPPAPSCDDVNLR